MPTNKASVPEVPITPMTYMLFPLTKEESMKGGETLGWKYAKENESRWVDITTANYELQTYDRGYSLVVYEGKVYNIHKDFIDVDNHVRLYIGKCFDLPLDKYPPEETAEPTPGEGEEEDSKKTGPSKPVLVKDKDTW